MNLFGTPLIAVVSQLRAATGIDAPILLTTLLFIRDAVDWARDQLPWPPFDFFGAGVAVWEWFVNMLLTGFLNAVAFFFMLGLESFLFYENPRHIDALNEYWVDSLILYVFIVFGTMFAYYVMMMLLADTDDANIQRIVERLILSGIFLMMSREVFAFFVELTNSLAYGILPENYSFYVGVEILEAITGAITVSVTALVVAIFGGLGILISGMIFYVVLAMRMLLIYVVYALMPILLALWVVDVGPGKYGKTFADILIKLAAVMMILGIVIAAILSVGAAFGEPEVSDQVEMASDFDAGDDGTIVKSTDYYGPTATVEAGEGGEVDSRDLHEMMRSMFMFLGSIWLIIAVMTSMAGMILSAGSASPGGTGGFTGHRGVGGSAGGPGGPGNQQWGARYQDATTGSAHVYQMGDGRQVIANPGGGGVVVNPNKSGPDWETFGPDNNPLASDDAPVNPFNSAPKPTDPGSPLKDKADQIKADIGDTLDEKADLFTQGDASAEGVTPTELASDAKSAVGGARDTLKDLTPNTVLKAGNLARRSGRAAWEVSKQPTVDDSVAEARRIFDESPITGPNPAEDPPEQPGDGPIFAQGDDAFVLGREADEFGEYWETEETAAAGAGTGTGPDADAGTDTGAETGTGSGSGGETGDGDDTVIRNDYNREGPLSSDEMAERLDSDPEDFEHYFDDYEDELGSGAGYAGDEATDDYDIDDELEDFEFEGAGDSAGTPTGTDSDVEFGDDVDTDVDVDDAAASDAETGDDFFDDEDTVNTTGGSEEDIDGEVDDGEPDDVMGGAAGTMDYAGIPDRVNEDVEAATEEIESLRERWESASGRSDNPYPGYYADAVEQGVELVDDVPEVAEELERQGLDPEKFSRELSKQAEEASKTFNEILGEKRSVDLAAAQQDIEGQDVSFEDGVGADDVTEMASQRPDERREMLSDDLSDLRSNAQEKTSDSHFHTRPGSELKEKLESKDFDSEEAELAFQVHVKNTTHALETSLDRDEFNEFNNRTVF